ncbi:MAG: hypothetical protein FJ318_10270 [SAR202 cluster bacterium]|nr:hypothetical protein [SAR202 cluster bacterium]
MDQQPAPQRPPTPVDEGPGANQRLVGGVLIAISVALGILWYVITLSPYAPSQFYKRIAGIGESVERVSLLVLAATIACLVGGIALYRVGKAAQRRHS